MFRVVLLFAPAYSAALYLKALMELWDMFNQLHHSKRG
jgi:hypothetical protein